METELIIIGVILFLLFFIALLPLVLGSGKTKAKKPKRGVAKSQVCLQPGCLRCAFSSDLSSLHAFKRHLWQSFLDFAKAIEDETELKTLNSRIGPAIKRLVTSSVTPAQSHSLLSVDGLPLSFTSVLKRAQGVQAENDAFAQTGLAWIDQLLPVLPQLAEEARQLWSERHALQAGDGDKGAKGRWRKQQEEGLCTGWKWDLWNQGSLIDAHAQRTPDTSGCVFGFVYFHVVVPEEMDPVEAVIPEDEGLRHRNAKSEEEKNEERSEGNENEKNAREGGGINGGERPHQRSGPTNARLRCRFVLSTPDSGGAFSVVLRVGSAEEKWESGTCLVSDCSQPHELRIEQTDKTIKNQDECVAMALVVDVWHPELAPVERQVLSTLFPASVDVASSALVD